MTLGRLVLAWVPVALWFAALGWVGHRLVGGAASPPPTIAPLLATAVESLVVTLFASLWFDTLGHGAWWVLFGLVGLLASALPTRPAFLAIALNVVRYVAAGALLSWRLR
jgi:hypothetical protein